MLYDASSSITINKNTQNKIIIIVIKTQIRSYTHSFAVKR